MKIRDMMYRGWVLLHGTELSIDMTCLIPTIHGHFVIMIHQSINLRHGINVNQAM